MDAAEFTDQLSCTGRERVAELALVLEAQAIESRLSWNGQAWVLSVPSSQRRAAERELAAYAEELRARAAPHVETPANGRPWPGIAAYLGLIVGMALLAPGMIFGVDWLAAGQMHSARLFAGEWWRPITALSLHADAPHLLGNAVFGSLFGFSVARYLGGGFGWLAILASGAIGNLANAFLSGPDHRSIGASTAVFAALGLLSAWCWRRGFPAAASRRERLAPVIAGIALLAFTGTGGMNTDIGAHLTGFLAGFGGGLLIARMTVPTSPRAQLACGLAAAAAVVLAWLAAIA